MNTLNLLSFHEQLNELLIISIHNATGNCCCYTYINLLIPDTKLICFSEYIPTGQVGLGEITIGECAYKCHQLSLTSLFVEY